MIQPGFAAIGPGGTYGSPTSFGSNVNNPNAGQVNNGMHENTGMAGVDGNGQQQHNGMGGGGGGVGGGMDGHAVQQAQQPEYSLAGILHFLQSEWRRYERDRNEWEIERAELRARVALFEGERKSVENRQTDLMRRVKMLEFALRHERSKYLASTSSSTTNNAQTAPGHPVHPKHAALQYQDKASSSSGRSSPAPDQSTIVSGHDNGSVNAGTQRGHMTLSSQGGFSTLNMGTMNGTIHSAAGGAGDTFGSTNALGTSGTGLTRQGSSAKDPKARAKSRDYLKQCLQEISYLTSTSTLNPLPERGQPGSILGPGHVRPRKTMSEGIPSSFSTAAPNAQPNDVQGTMTAAARRQRSVDKTGSLGSRASASVGRSVMPFSETLEEKEEDVMMEEVEGSAKGYQLQQQGAEEQEEVSTDGLALDKSTLAPLSDSSAESSSFGSAEDSHSFADMNAESSHSSADELPRDVASDDNNPEPITAIYRPNDGSTAAPEDDWAKLREAGRIEREKRERGRAASTLQNEEPVRLSSAGALKSDEEDLASLSLHDNDANDDASRIAAEAAAESQMWKSKRVLRGHLDGVRSVVFDSSNLGLYSASDDGTIKFWKIDAHTLKQNKPQTQATGSEADPVATLRGHSGAVTSLAISLNKERLYSGSVDSSIVVWKLLDGKNVEPYPPFDKSSEVTRLVGHTQPVWDLCIVPTKGDDEGLLASASADGTLKIWSTQDGPGSVGGRLMTSFDYFGLEPSAEKEAEKQKLIDQSGALPVPTSVSPCLSDLRRIAVSFSNAVVKLFDVQSGKEVMHFASDAHSDGTPATQINKVITHPTLPILITGHENHYIQFFDMDSGACTLSMVAHLDSVTTLDIDPSGLTLVSGGHDCSVRFWDIVSSNESIAAAAATLSDKRNSGVSDANQANGDRGSKKSDGNGAVCVQEITAHRKKSDEGVLVAKYHPNATWFCSAGADGVIRIYG